MKIDKVNDEFIVDCTNNSKEERQQVYKFLVDNRDYGIHYLTNDYPIIACNKRSGQTNWVTLIQYYNWFNAKKDIPVYTFEQFKEMYLNENKMYSIKDLEKRKNGKCWVVQINTKNEHKFLKSYFPEMTYYRSDFNGYIVDMTNCGISEFCNYDGGDYNKITINQIKEWNMENKKIIGYKLIKPEYKEAALAICHTVSNWENSLAEYDININQKEYIRKLTNANVFDLWFEAVYEAVYEEEYKVGDWVITKGYHKDHNGIALKITLISDKKYCYFEHNGIGTPNFNIKNIERKATPEEIKDAQKTIVKMHSSNKGEFEIEVVDGKAYYRPENKHLPKEWIRDIINSYGNILIQKNVINPYNVEISSINVGCYHNCKKEDWENVYKLLK